MIRIRELFSVVSVREGQTANSPPTELAQTLMTIFRWRAHIHDTTGEKLHDKTCAETPVAFGTAGREDRHTPSTIFVTFGAFRREYL